MPNPFRLLPHSQIEVLERRVLFAIYGADDTFGSLGAVQAPGNDVVDVLPSGKILAVGTRHVPAHLGEPATDQTIASRLNADGSLDKTFNGTGFVDLGQTQSVAYTGSRLYIVPVPGADSPTVRAYTPAGALDKTFSADGVQDIPWSLPAGKALTSLTVRQSSPTPDGGVLLRTFVYSDATQYQEIVKLKADGSPDSAFASNGVMIAAVDGNEILSATLTARGLYFVQLDGNGYDVTRWHTDGKTIDTSFGKTAPILVNLPGDFKELDSGKILALRTSVTNGERLLSRLLPDGSFDTSFNVSGIAVIPGAVWEKPVQLQLDDQGRIIVINGDRIYRYSADGVEDAAAPFDGQVVPFGKIEFDAQGRLLVGTVGALQRLDSLPPLQITSDHILHVNGTDASDAVTIESSRGQQPGNRPGNKRSYNLKVTLNGAVTEYDARDIVGLHLTLDEGTNTAVVAVNLPTTVTSGGGSDAITTSNADDNIVAGGGANVISCGDGNDTIVSGNNVYDPPTTAHTITGGNGAKHIRLESGRMIVSLGVGNSDISTGNGAGNDHITIAGGSSRIVVAGGEAVVSIGGSGKNDVTVGARGTADINTGAGNDTFNLYGGATIHSGAGDDSFLLAGKLPVNVFAGDGNDKVNILNAYSVTHATIHGENGDDRLHGGNGTQFFYGDAGNDRIYGGTGSDMISGGGGNDRLFGEGGSDRLYGGAGRDRLTGNAGDDQLFGGASSDTVFANSGNDQLSGQGGNDRLYTNSGAGTATLHGGSGDDRFITKNTFVDNLFGDEGNDTAIADSSDVLTDIESTT